MRPVFRHLPPVVEHLHGHVGRDRTRSDAARYDPAEIWIGFQDGAKHAERPALPHAASSTWRRDEIEQRGHALRSLGLPGFSAIQPSFADP